LIVKSTAATVAHHGKRRIVAASAANVTARDRTE
jgi:hypothetical protein